MKASQIIKLSILSGVFISLGGWAYLALGGVIGMIMFTFGLLAVVHFGTTLYTGTAGFKFENKWRKLPLILFFNVIGCILVGLLTRFSSMDLANAAQNIIMNRIDGGFFTSLFLGIGCGIVMTTAVAFSPNKQYLPLLFGVPLFIACGFQHSIADAFYISACSFEFFAENAKEILFPWFGVVIGNYIGCNLQMVLGIPLKKDI